MSAHDQKAEYGGEADDDGHDHCRAKHDARGVQQSTAGVGRRIEKRHPEPCQAHQESATNQEPPGHPLSGGPAPSAAGGELEWPQGGEHGGAHDVQDHR